MKRIIIILTVFLVYAGSLDAQEPRFIFDNDSINQVVNDIPSPPAPSENIQSDTLNTDSLHRVLPEIPSWHIDPRFGERYVVEMDTLFDGYHQKSLVDGQDVAVGYLGNWGSPAQSKIFFERNETSQFGFLDVFNYYYKTPGKHTFLDIKEPYSNFKYHSGGGRQSKEESLDGIMSLSFNKRFTLGFDINYLYSRGFYNSLSNKQINYSVFSSYITDRYKMHAIFMQNNYTNIENGGLAFDGTPNDGFLNSENSRDFVVNLSDTWNRLRGRQFYMNHKYSIGYDEDETEKFVPVASIIWASHYADQKRSFTTDQLEALDNFYSYTEPEDDIERPTSTSVNNTELSTSSLNDRMSYYSFKNTLSIALNEGFREWVKFGLTGFIEYDTRKYTLPGLYYPSLTLDEYSQNSTVIGGLLSKQKGEHLRYNLYADLGVLGYNKGELRLKADITTQFKIKDRDVVVKANAYVKNLKPTFFETNYVSRYYNWTDNAEIAESSNRFGEVLKLDDIKRSFVGGEIYVPSTRTRLSGGVENIENYIYYDRANDNAKVTMSSAAENIQVLSLRLDQKFKVGVLNFNNQLVFQHSSNDLIIPLPKLSLYSNLYLQFKVANVLDMQFGIDAHFHTKYFAPGYDPALLQFHNQHEREIGSFPISTVYANFHLKRTRFFVMMYNVGSKITDKNFFVIDKYPINPMIFKFGLTWNFMN